MNGAKDRFRPDAPSEAAKPIKIASPRLCPDGQDLTLTPKSGSRKIRMVTDIIATNIKTRFLRISGGNVHKRFQRSSNDRELREADPQQALIFALRLVSTKLQRAVARNPGDSVHYRSLSARIGILPSPFSAKP